MSEVDMGRIVSPVSLLAVLELYDVTCACLTHLPAPYCEDGS